VITLVEEDQIHRGWQPDKSPFVCRYHCLINEAHVDLGGW
jgi:hypothetical protein